jgi:hypothetical protein
MRSFDDDTYFNEKIRQLAVEQMAMGVISIALTRRADGGIEVAIAREITDFGGPASGYVDRESKAFVKFGSGDAAQVFEKALGRY